MRNIENQGISTRRKLNFLLALLFSCFSLLSYGQSVAAPSVDTTASAQKQYVKLEIGMHILDCPVLPKQLKAKLMTVQGIKDYHEDMMTQSIYFNIPEGAVSKEQIMSMAASCSFPPKTVNVLMDKKPFTN